MFVPYTLVPNNVPPLVIVKLQLPTNSNVPTEPVNNNDDGVTSAEPEISGALNVVVNSVSLLPICADIAIVAVPIILILPITLLKVTLSNSKFADPEKVKLSPTLPVNSKDGKSTKLTVPTDKNPAEDVNSNVLGSVT